MSGHAANIGSKSSNVKTIKPGFGILLRRFSDGCDVHAVDTAISSDIQLFA